MLDAFVRTRILQIGALRLRFHPLVALCVLLACGGLIRLGVWQLDRAGEKIALQENFLSMQAREAVPVQGILPAGLERDTALHQNRQVSLRGEYLNDRSIFLIYQTFEEEVGYEIITPFRVADADLIVPVSRGWTGAMSYEQLAAKLPRIEGELELRGQIYVPRPAEAERRNGSWEPRWPLLIRYLNIEELAPAFDAPLFPYAVRLNEGQPGVLVRHWAPVRVDMDRNFSYALQWFAMAMALLIVSVLLGSNALQLMQKKADPL